MNFFGKPHFLALVALAWAATTLAQGLKPDYDAARPIASKDTVFIEQMTWMEVRDALADGKTTAIIASGGVEQNGPYLEAGAHQVILSGLTDRIARKLGNALVAPIISYVPEGNIDPPSGHMLYPSTLSVSNETFMAIVRDAANSLRAHGFDTVILIGDSAGNQTGMKAVAEELAAQWSGSSNRFGKSPRIHYIKEYYNNARWNEWLVEQGYEETSKPFHDDLRHEAIMMFVDPASLRFEERKAAGLLNINGIDVSDAPKIAELGDRLIDYHADVTIAAIKEAMAR